MSGSVDLFSTDRQTRSSVVKVGESLVGWLRARTHEGRAGAGGGTPALHACAESQTAADMHGLFLSLFSHPFLVQPRFQFRSFQGTQNQLNSASLFPGKNGTVSLSCCCCDVRLSHAPLPSFVPAAIALQDWEEDRPNPRGFLCHCAPKRFKIDGRLSLSVSVTSLPTSSPSSSSTEFVSHCFQGRVRVQSQTDRVFCGARK